ncbi:MAG: class I SAM-dependent methyltransferase [Anaerolineales bacterium]|nr:class I SAM-dependent methyltransferase [Anaerolineales bacterium]
MQKIPDWVRLWRELVEIQSRVWATKKRKRNQAKDAWKDKARSYDKQVDDRWTRPDSSRKTITARLQAQPDSTLLDIGAGTGAWACYLARYARQVTAIEPSASMIEVMEAKIAAEGIENVRIVQGSWPEIEVDRHDFSLCSHSMYGYPDLPAFINRMIKVTYQTCFLLMRAPDPDGIMAEAARRVWGQPYDSPNFNVAYNALLQMGLFPNVLMEEAGLWKSWTNDSIEDAMERLKSRLDLPVDGPNVHDAFLYDLLQERLAWQDGQFIWPSGVRSALIYWDVE